MVGLPRAITVGHPCASDTRVTLVGRLIAAPNDPAAWSEFVEWYGRKIYAGCRAWGLQESDAQDVTQEVFLNRSVRMQRSRYEPRGSFGAWLIAARMSPSPSSPMG